MSDAGRHVPWKRFWIPRDAVPVLHGEYFADPEAEVYGRSLGFNAEAKTFDELDEKGCLVLLGEPGIGKSHVPPRAMAPCIGIYPVEASLSSCLPRSTVRRIPREPNC